MMRLLLLVFAFLLPGVVQAESRIALVIGNSAYASGPLPNPANDARLVGETLKQLGFVPIVRLDADQITMKRAIQEFGSRLEKAGPGAVGLFYYAGHGVQLNGRNYLIPTRATIEREGDVEIEAVSADWVIEQMRYARNGLNIVILDACRNNPFTRSMRSADRGLATMDAPAGILIAYSTAPGAVAEDGNGRNSPYTTALTKAMLEHQPVEQVFKHVRVGVMGATSGKQVPWEASSLVGEDFFFVPPEKAAPQVAKAPPPLAPASAAPAVERTAMTTTPAPAKSSGGVWDTVTGWFGSDKTDTHPAGTPAPGPAAHAAPAVDGASIPGAQALAFLTTLGVATDGIDASHDYAPATLRALIESGPRHATLGSTAQQIRAALTLCKQYSGACQLSWYGDEVLRSATLKPFELDSAPVSVRAFRQFADSTHYRTHAEKAGFAYVLVDGSHLTEVAGGSWRNALKKHPVEDDAPVVGVSFEDALAYCRSNGARLPSEDEWEYVARGPNRSVFPWGDDASPVARALSVPPRATDGPAEGIGGRYKGLSGNVWQWVDTRAKERRVLKGGSWLEANAANKRAAARRLELPDMADEDSGFRCARSVPVWPDADYWVAQLSKGR